MTDKADEVQPPVWRDQGLDTPPAPWHDNALKALQKRVARDALPQALLILGPDGVGKTAFARRFVAALNCKVNADPLVACGECHDCQQIARGVHPNLSLLLPTKKGGVIPVDAVREFSRRIFLTGQPGEYRIGVIDPADALNVAAANALLKTLEEPPAGVLIVLLSARVTAIPATIRSRCQILRIPAPEAADATNWLRAQPAMQAISDALPDLLCIEGPYSIARRLASGADALEQEMPAQLRREIAYLCRPTCDYVALATHWRTNGLESRLKWLWQDARQALEARTTGSGALPGDSPLAAMRLTRLALVPKRCQQMLRELTTQQNKQALTETFLIGLRHDLQPGQHP